MKIKISSVISCVIAAFLLVLNVSAEEHIGMSDGIVSYLLAENNAKTVQEWIDSDLVENAGTSAEWYAIALSQSGDYDFTAYKTALERYVQSNTIRSATSRQKYALALLAVGSNSDYVAQTMENSIGEQGIMSYVYGLHLLNNDCTSSQHTAESVVEVILSMQMEDGGWAVMGENGDPDVTAMTIQALAKYYSVDENVTNAVDKAVQFLSEKQLENGGYKSMGKESSESISQVIIALSVLGTDAETDIHFIKNGNTLFSALNNFQLSNGSFCHEIGGDPNHTATVQAFMAAKAYDKMKQENGSLLIFENDMSTETIETSVVETTAEIQKSVESEQEKKTSYKPIVCISICGAAAVICVIFFITKKRNIKNFIAVGIGTALVLAVVMLTDFSSAEDYYGKTSVKEKPVGTVTLEIRCDTVAGRKDYIPESGVILAEKEYAFEEGETVYDILVEACRSNEIQMESSGGEMAYIAGINYIYEFDFGDLSGWMYFVNGEEASVDCNSYSLTDGDKIEWLYSCEMGNDLK